MKTGVITLFGRTGSILLVVGFGLALVYISLTPSGSVYEPRFTAAPGRYGPIPPYGQIYSLLNGLRISGTFNNSLQLYVLGTHHLQLRERIRSMITEQFPDLNESQVYQRIFDASVLEAFLRIHPDEVLLNETVKGEWSIDFFPPKVTNVTVVVSNGFVMPSSVNMKITPIVALVPRERAVTLTKVLIVSGMVLAIPWAVKKTRDYVRSG